MSREANLVVVLSSYNGARFIAEQIESIRQQTRRSWVLLVRDDGSRDDTVRIVETHSAVDPRIVLLRDGRGNLGPAASFSALLEHAAGAGAEYVALCDQDDVWRPDKLGRELQLMEEHERTVGRDVPLLVHSDLTVVDQDLRIVHPSFVSYQKLGRESVRPLRRLLVQNFVTGCTTVINRALLRAAVPLPPVVMHDWWLALCAGALGQLLYLAEPTVLYRQHAGNTVGGPGWRRLITESLSRPVALWWRRGNANLAEAVDQARELAVCIERHGRETSVTYPSLAVVRDFCDAFAGDVDSLSRMRTMFRHGIRPRSLLGFPLAFYGRTLLWRRTSAVRFQLDRVRWALRCAWRGIHPGSFAVVRDALAGRHGLEIGGPSTVFHRGQLWPLYHVIGALDLANYAVGTIWDNDTVPLLETFPHGLIQRVFVAEATRLADVPNAKYDFLLASHVLEHIANPFAALREWARVLRPDGLLFMIVPHHDGTFDHRRPVTSLTHLIDDYRAGTGESDETHVEEVLRLHDLARDLGAGDASTFAARTRRNAAVRAMHHHVFDTLAALRVVDAAGFEIVYVDVQLPSHIAVASIRRGFRDPVVGDSPALSANARWLGADASWRLASPFPSDYRG